MIFNRSLSAEQINSIYQDGLANHSVTKIVSQETKVGENWSVMVTPTDQGVDGTPKLSHNLTILSTPPTQPTLNLNSTLGTNFTTENLTVYISGSTDEEGNNIYNITDWRLNGSSLAILNMPFDNNDLTKARDYSVYGNNGTVAQTNWYSNGKVGGTYDFNSNGYINIPATNDLDVQNLTISLWFNTTNGGSTVWIFEKGTINTQYSLILALGNLTFRTVNATGSINDMSYTSMSGVSNKSWHHLVATYNGTHKAVYIDGLLNSTGIYSDTLATGLNTGATIGSYPGLDAFNFNGRMDELMIFNRSLSAEQIASMYQDGLANHSVTKIVSQETKVGENLSVMVTPNDLYGDGTSTLSHNLTILANTAPTISLTSPGNNNITQDRALTLSWSGSDNEGDTLWYDINLNCSGGCSADNRIEDNYVGTVYTPSPDLQHLADNNQWYMWTIRSCENATVELLCSDWASTRSINITAVVSINLTNDFINFGTLALGATNNTTHEALDPFLIKNIGNSKVNISVNATAIWDSQPLASNYFMSKAGNFTGNATWANNSWFQLPPTTTPLVFVNSLNYTNGVDQIEAHILLEVPTDENPETKTSTVYFHGSLSE